MAERLVETRFLPPPTGEKIPTLTFSIEEKHIDGYNHVNHAWYIRLFDAARPTPPGQRVSALSVSYGEQFRLGDTAQITTNVYPKGSDGLEIISQEMRKPNSDNTVTQATRLVPYGPDDLTSKISFEPEKNPVVIDERLPLILPGPQNVYHHTEFAPIFESERARIVREKGVTVEQLRDEFHTRIMVTRLDASFSGFFRGQEAAEITNQAYLRRGSLVFYQMLVGQGGQEVKQLTHYLFIGNNDKAKPLDKGLVKLLSS